MRKKLYWITGGLSLLAAFLFVPMPEAVLDHIVPPVVAPAAAQLNQCPNKNPGFTAGGTVFGRSKDQWNQYFTSKVDAVNGVLCNPTVIGGSLAANIPDHTFMGNASGGTAPAVPLPATPPLYIQGGAILFAGACSDLSDDGTACTANVGTSGATLGLLNADKTDSGNNTFSGSNLHSGNNSFSGNNGFTGTNTFATVNGTVVTLAGTSLVLDTTYCGKTVYTQNAATTTITLFGASGIPAGKSCAIGIVQRGAGNAVFASAGNTILNPIGCTRAFGQGAIASLYVAGDEPTVWFLGGSCLP